MPSYAQLSNELAVPNNVLGVALATEYHRLSFHLEDTKKKQAGCMEDFKDAKDGRNSFGRQSLLAESREPVLSSKKECLEVCTGRKLA